MARNSGGGKMDGAKASRLGKDKGDPAGANRHPLSTMARQTGRNMTGLGKDTKTDDNFTSLMEGLLAPHSVPLPLRGCHVRSSSPGGEPLIPRQCSCTRSQLPRRLPRGGPSSGARNPRVPIPLAAVARAGLDGGPEGGVGDRQRPLPLRAEQTRPSRHRRIQVGLSMSGVLPRGLRAGYTRLAGRIRPPHVARASTGRDPGGPRAAIIRAYLSVGTHRPGLSSAHVGCIDPVRSPLFFAEAYSGPTCVGDFSHCMD
ncbi:hypothetical protein NDU88_009969 [Pleurodeles waltl]|uniref:Uncharacterized protein n=1 Tax=Pleurodeles waltl TaxID=8319 RepID=A0AAV7RY53_PLEWA|nr:hypothetical protein NDU88_009969 [Pleurodeles waltl]